MMQSFNELERILNAEVDKGLEAAEQRLHMASEQAAETVRNYDELFRDDLSRALNAELMACAELRAGYAVLPERGTFIYRTDAGTIKETDDPMEARNSKNLLMKVTTELELDSTNTKEPMKAQYTRFELTSFSDELQSKSRMQAASKPQLNKESVQALKSKENKPPKNAPGFQRG